MSHAETELETRSTTAASLPRQREHARSGIAPAPRKERATTLPPPPPAAGVRRSERSVAQLPASSAETFGPVKLPPTSDELWPDAGTAHFAASLRAPALPREAAGWRRAGLGLAALALLGTGYATATARGARKADANSGVHATQSRSAQRAASPAPLTAAASLLDRAESSYAATALGQGAARSVTLASLAAPVTLPAGSTPSAASPTARRKPATEQAEPEPAAHSESAVENTQRVVQPSLAEVPEPAELAAETTATPEDGPPAPALPAQPARQAIVEGFAAIRPALAECAGTTHGTTFANVTIASSGRVTYGVIDGAFAGTPQGSCMARALRSATFPAFSAANLKVRYPFAL